MKKVLLLVLVLFLASCSSNAGVDRHTIKLNDQTQQTENKENVPTPESKQNAKNAVSLGDLIIVDGFELTFNEPISFFQIDNQYSEDNGKYVLGVPVHVKNASGETGSVNNFYLSAFGPDGNEVKTTTLIDSDNMVGFDGDMRDQAEKDSVYYFIYAGDGEYVIEYDDFTSKGEIHFNVIK